MSRVLVTGGAGFIGSEVVRQLLMDGHEVTLYDSMIHYSYPLKQIHLHNIHQRMDGIKDKVRIVRGATQDFGLLTRTLRDVSPTHIIHLAAMPLANMALERPEEAFNSILSGTMNLLQILQQLSHVERFVYVSSSMVYGDFVTIPAPESHPTKPKDVYGGLKLSGEILTRVYGGLYGFDYVVIRPTAVYGPTDNNRRVLSIFLSNALGGKPLVVRGSEQALDFTFVSDTAKGIVGATFHPNASQQTFNISRGEGRTILEAAEIVAGLVPETRIETTDSVKHMPSRGALDITAARSRIGYEPEVSLENGLEKYLDYLKRQQHQSLGV